MDIQLEFLSNNVLSQKQGNDRIKFLLSNIKNDKILVLEDTLNSKEVQSLITSTMKQISSSFPGIEISTLGTGKDDFKARIIKLLGGKTGGLTVIGPSHLIKQIKSDPNKIHLLAGEKEPNGDD